MNAKDLRSRYGDMVEKAIIGILSGAFAYFSNQIKDYGKDIESLKIRTSVIEQRLNSIDK